MKRLAKSVRKISIRAEEGAEESVEEGMSRVTTANEEDLIDRNRERVIGANLPRVKSYPSCSIYATYQLA